jgi:hypothetical protein
MKRILRTSCALKDQGSSNVDTSLTRQASDNKDVQSSPLFLQKGKVNIIFFSTTHNEAGIKRIPRMALQHRVLDLPLLRYKAPRAEIYIINLFPLV